eukprot:s951_g23.t1
MEESTEWVSKELVEKGTEGQDASFEEEQERTKWISCGPILAFFNEGEIRPHHNKASDRTSERSGAIPHPSNWDPQGRHGQEEVLGRKRNEEGKFGHDVEGDVPKKQCEEEKNCQKVECPKVATEVEVPEAMWPEQQVWWLVEEWGEVQKQVAQEWMKDRDPYAHLAGAAPPPGAYASYATDPRYEQRYQPY